MTNLQPVGIISVGGYAPPDVLTNHDLEKIVDTSDEWIRTRSGISTRHVASQTMATSDIAYPAAVKALERAGMTPEELDLIVIATFTPDMLLPATACFLQHKLGAINAVAYDISAACSGFVYALSVTYPLVASGMYRNAMVIGADCLTKMTDYTDRGTCVLLGDGAGAVIIKPVPEGRGVLSTYLRTDGSGTEILNIPGGGTRHPASEETLKARMHYIHMNGSEVFKFAVRVIEEAVHTALNRAGLTTSDVSLVIPHQANVRIIDAAAKRLDIPYDRWANYIKDYGNTSAGSIPLALSLAYDQGRIHEGDVIVFVGFGGGLTWGATVVRW